MPYGKRRYGRVNKPVEQPTELDLAGVPTYICGKCKNVKTADKPYIKITISEKDKLLYIRMCEYCTGLLKTWIKG